MKTSLQHNRAITLGDRNDTDFYWEEVYKQQKKESVHFKRFWRAEHQRERTRCATVEGKPIQEVYTTSRYVPERKLIIWASAIDGKIQEVMGGMAQVEVLKHRRLLSAMRTLGALVGLNGIIYYYYDDPTWSEALDKKLSPATDKPEQQLWNCLLNLSAQRNVTWAFLGDRKPWVWGTAEKYLKSELARLSSAP
jgi:hypothetical protein